MLRHCAVLIVVIAITCQFYHTKAVYSLFNIYYCLVLSLFAILVCIGAAPGITQSQHLVLVRNNNVALLRYRSYAPLKPELR